MRRCIGQTRVDGDRGRRAIWRGFTVAVVIVTLVTGCGADDSPSPILPDTTPTTTATDSATMPAGSSSVPATPAATVSEASPNPGPTLPGVPTPGATLPANQAFSSAAADIGPIVWATAIDPVTFAPIQSAVEIDSLAPVIYAVVPVRRIEPGTTVSAAWTYNDTPIPATAPAVTAAERRDAVWLAFDLTRGMAESWPDGQLAVTISVNGQPVSGAEVTIVPAAG